MSTKVAYSFIAGVLQNAPGITAITNQLVNSYKRLGGFEAPDHVCWTRHGREALVRVPKESTFAHTGALFDAAEVAGRVTDLDRACRFWDAVTAALAWSLLWGVIGTAKDGLHHWWTQRITAVALVLITCVATLGVRPALSGSNDALALLLAVAAHPDAGRGYQARDVPLLLPLSARPEAGLVRDGVRQVA